MSARAADRSDRDDSEALTVYIREHRAGGYPVHHVVHLGCRHCDGRAFRVAVDDEEGCALLLCLGCGTEAAVADSDDYLDDAELAECACPCGAESFAVAVGYALAGDGEVRWVSVGLRCLADGALGVYTDWKIDYAPTAHLLPSATPDRQSAPTGSQRRPAVRAAPSRQVSTQDSGMIFFTIPSH
ncbi:hypothetical protein ACIBJE_25730 [Micromonospora sp. NPDC050187]|uniref:hypothetical protein n=1 Tax=Micromonospora sp. NPDC050187 TaxID=3364277 RepID=UPI0037A94E1F